ncbi:DNA-binding transcriptional activator FeaR [Marinomonas spartinae]|uniref:AraC family transcriptional regulator n=1 Tax=Marinomonas spartinae TaxID=1792290 RepID=UPI000808DDEC|nr:AraC family transcriptional regulator [Marinomonas spartinae]SBS32111.1 DNA-binding transcriptional activator FeaR [Marinomonas spartinae]
MQIDLHYAYDSQGDIKDHYASAISGYKRHIALMPNLELTEQHISCQQDCILSEQAKRGLYFTIASDNIIKTTDDIHSINISYLPKNWAGDFYLKQGEKKSLIQMHILPEQLAQVLGETEDQTVQYFNHLFHILEAQDNTLNLPVTDKNKTVWHAILAHTGHNLSLVGHAYACIFTLIEQLKMLKHLTQCSDCQSKIFHAQNLLEVPQNLNLKPQFLANQVGLNEEALTLGFHYLVGQSITSYSKHRRIQYAAEQLRKNPNAKTSIVADSGFSEAQFEAIFIQHFGISSQHYGQIH